MFYNYYKIQNRSKTEKNFLIFRNTRSRNKKNMFILIDPVKEIYQIFLGRTLTNEVTSGSKK